jgi:hypothetical protein
VIKIEENEFDLFLRIDSNTKGHVQWFYFSIANGSKREKVKLNLCNLSKAKSLYESVALLLFRGCSPSSSLGSSTKDMGRIGHREAAI